jgi:teichuronic acid biosynthesis glycosyltransferase TuaC
VKVLMLSHMYPSAVNPTAGIFVEEQVRALIRRGHDVRVLSPRAIAPPLLPRWKAHRQVPGVEIWDGIPVLRPRKLSLPRALLGPRNSDAMLTAIARPLKRVHAAWKFDVIHAHMLVPDGWAAACVGAELDVPVLATAHRADVLDIPARGESSRRKVAQAIDSIEQIATVSDAIRRATESVGSPRRPVRVVPNGADTTVFRPIDRDEALRALGIAPDGPVISYVGKLVPRKGVMDLAEALGTLSSGPNPPPTLLAAGIGELREDFERRASELGIADRVHFLGKVPHEQVATVMAAGDVFVLPSLSEGLPTVICEAMACARPVVATAVDGTPEIVRDGETGRLVPPREPAALASALSEVLYEPDKARAMGDRALEIALETYTWDANAALTEELYEAICH